MEKINLEDYHIFPDSSLCTEPRKYYFSGIQNISYYLNEMAYVYDICVRHKNVLFPFSINLQIYY